MVEINIASNNASDIFGVSKGLDNLTNPTKPHGFLRSMLEKVCTPAAEELGELFKEKIQGFRHNNLNSIESKTREIAINKDFDGLHASPRVVYKIIEDGSWQDDNDVQYMWAGLLASSCSEECSDDSNLVYVRVLGQITKSQAKLINYLCENVKVTLTNVSLVTSGEIMNISTENLRLVMNIDSLARIDVELDDLRNLGFFGLDGPGFVIGLSDSSAHIRPSAFALNFYSRCKGFINPRDCFNL